MSDEKCWWKAHTLSRHTRLYKRMWGRGLQGLVKTESKPKNEELSLSYQESRDCDWFGEHLPLNIIIHMKIPDFIWVSSLLVYSLPQRLFGGFFLFTNFYPQCYSVCIHFSIHLVIQVIWCYVCSSLRVLAWLTVSTLNPALHMFVFSGVQQEVLK